MLSLARRMPFGLGQAGLGVALAALVIGGAIVSEDEAQAQASYEIEPRDPEFLYSRVCGYCHGKNVAPIIRGKKLPAPVIEIMVRSGIGAMPAFKPTEITDTELEALAQWLAVADADPEEHGK